MGIRLSLFMRLRHCPFLFKTVQAAFDHVPMLMSVILHATVIILLTCDFVSETKRTEVVSVPIFEVDLTKVKIADMTNLPPKLRQNSEAKKPSGRSVRTSAYSKAAAAPRVASSSSAASKSSSSGAALEDLIKNVSSGKKADKKSASSVSAPASNTIQGAPAAAQDDLFKTLLASVDGIKNGMGYADADTADVNPDEVVTDGIEGGQGGSYMQELSVSEKDMIGIKLRSCWNIDAGVRGAHNMIIELRVFLKNDGGVKEVKILNTARYNKDTAFRSLAESARRAVFICDKKEDSPFKIFAKNYEQSYDSWKTLLLRFNPIDGGVN